MRGHEEKRREEKTSRRGREMAAVREGLEPQGGGHIAARISRRGNTTFEEDSSKYSTWNLRQFWHEF